MDQNFTLTIVLDNGEEDWAQMHQCLLMLLDSPMNHAGFLEIYIRLTGKDNRVIRLHKEVRIPRTFKRFEQLFINFLQGCDMPLVQTKEGPARLFQFISKPLDKILPNNCPKYRISNLIGRVRTADYFAETTVETNKRAVIHVDFASVDPNFLGDTKATEYEIKVKVKDPEPDTYSISHYPIPASLICVKITSAFEKALDVF